MHRVVFTPSGLEGKVPDGTSVLDAARQIGADLDTVCGGRGICGRCQITPSTGRFAKWHLDVGPDALGPPAAIELDYRGNRPLTPGNRLGCAARSTATWSSTCRRRARCTARWSARTLPFRRWWSTRGSPSTSSRSRRRCSATRSAPAVLWPQQSPNSTTWSSPRSPLRSCRSSTACSPPTAGPSPRRCAATAATPTPA